MPKYRNPLVISDNFPLLVQFKKLVDGKAIRDVTWTFVSSPFSDFSALSEQAGFSTSRMDLRDPQVVADIVQRFDLVISMHSKQIFPPALVSSVKCINVHPGYNPINRGWYPQVFAIINDLPVGATIHEMDELLDHGNIIDRDFVPIKASDTSLSLYERITQKEIELLDKNIESIINNEYTAFPPEGDGNLFLKKDFNQLRVLDLNERSTAREFINKIRALTHGAYKNVFFVDPESGKKVYVSIHLEEENF